MIDPADPDQLFQLLRRHRVELKHSLGQNFIVDPAVRDHIADAAGLTRDDDVLEVGAGAGGLTIALASRARRVTAVELDRRLIPVLNEVSADLDNVEWLHGDGRSLNPVADGSVDGCISHVVFRHLPSPSITLGYIREMGRVLRPGDKLLAFMEEFRKKHA